MLTIKDAHKQNGTIDIEGVWIYTYPNGVKRIGADIGETAHSINHIYMYDGKLVLDKASFGGTYTPKDGIVSWDVTHNGAVAERVKCDNASVLCGLIASTAFANIQLRKFVEVE